MFFGFGPKQDSKYLIGPKLIFLSMSMSFYVLHQFRTSFMKDGFGIQGDVIGEVMGKAQFIGFIGNLFIGAINDKLGKQKIMIFSLILISSIIFQLFFTNLSNSINFSIFYYIYFLLLSSVTPLSDKIALEYLKSVPGCSEFDYGRQKIFGSVGYILTTFTVESLLDRSKDGKEIYNLLKYYGIAVTVFSIACTLIFIHNVRVTSSRNFFSGFSRLINSEYLCFIGIIFLFGIARASMTMYLPLYIDKVLKLQTKWVDVENLNFLQKLSYFIYKPQSIISFSAMIPEMFIFYHGKRIVESIGHFMPMLLALLVQLLRFILYFILPEEMPFMLLAVCLIELLKGVGFGLVHLSGVSLASRLGPASVKSTSQIVYNGVFVAVGTLVAGFFFGKLFKFNTTIVEYSIFFKYNIILTIFTILLFYIIYGIKRNLIFNVENSKIFIENAEIRQLNE